MDAMAAESVYHALEWCGAAAANTGADEARIVIRTGASILRCFRSPIAHGGASNEAVLETTTLMPDLPATPSDLEEVVSTSVATR